MSAHKNKRKAGGKAVPAKSKWRSPRFVVVLVAAAVLVVADLVAYSLRQTVTERDVVSSGSTDDFKNLIGRWMRTDGDYIIHIREVDPGGRMDAAYYNPQPINISRAEASWKDDIQRLFIELRDKGYPGSTYTLNFSPKKDRLIGHYFQAAMGRNFEVVFVRKK